MPRFVADTRPVLDRIAERSETIIATRCIIWNGHRTRQGHGTITMAGRTTPVHRVAWEAINGPIPEGLDCLHNCPGGDNPSCWNVDHLWLGTQADNNADKIRKGRHVVPKGEAHPFAILTVEKVAAIRAMPEYRGVCRDAARIFNISISCAWEVRKRISWKHLP